MSNVIIYFEEQEHSALHQLTEREYRIIPAQAAMKIHRQLQSLGVVLPVEEPTASNSTDIGIGHATEA